MSNFEYLSTIRDFRTFSKAAIDAEAILQTSSEMSATSSRKALELAIKWIFNAERSLDYDPNLNLQGYVHNARFREIIDRSLWKQIQFVIKTGNRAVHSDEVVTYEDAKESLKCLFAFIDWMSSRYLREYTKRTFDENEIPKDLIDQNDERMHEAEKQVVEMTDRIRHLESEIASLSEQYTAERERNMVSRPYEPRDMSEYGTRKLYIDADLRRVGWKFDGQQVIEEYEVLGMQGTPDQKGFIDYVLFGKDGLPLAVIEAKRSSKDPNAGREQAKLYADCLERKFRRRPMMFTTNGYETYFWDDTYWPQRKVSGLFGREDLQRLMNRRSMRKDLLSIPIDDDITNRYYQKEAIRRVCDDLQNPSKKMRKHLLVMATGTGKTRTAAGLIDVLTRGNHVTNVLFLADRTALVLQAMDSFRENLPHVSQCNLCDEKSDINARIVVSTYQTVINRIDELRSKDGSLLFSPAHFDLIIIDECHRSIFRKFSAIFEYFDAVILGLTATPKMEVDRNTYRFFEMEDGIPTYVYDYETAVETDHYLVPFKNYEVKTRFLSRGIVYDDLSDKDKERYEEDFEEDGAIPDSISSNELNKTIFNISTVDMVLQDLMEHGIKIDGGDHLGKTIIFAQNKLHAEFIVDRFNKLYPQYNGSFAKRVVCDDSYSQGIIYDFKYKRDLEPQIVVSVDMMDTGVDVPDCVNLVFFKVVRSHTKFFQMIGRGTRLCPGIDFQDEIDGPYTDKRRFLIFDYCGNFEFFRLHPEGYESKLVKSLTQYIFEDRVTLIHILQRGDYSDDEHQAMRSGLVKICHGQISNLNRELAIVRLKLEYVVRYSDEMRFGNLGDGDVDDLRKQLGPIIPSDGDDENAKFFDKMMYDIMIRSANGDTPHKLITKVQKIGMSLETKRSIPQVREKMDTIREIQENMIWESGDILAFERVRMELRDLMKFLDKDVVRIVTTDLEDVIESYSKGEPTATGPSFENYHKKVNRYILENMDNPAIFKLHHNQKLTPDDFHELERIFTEELGTKDDYENEFGNIGVGEMVRKIVKVDHQSLMDAFSEFLNDSSMNPDQITFLHKIINYIEVEGMMEIDILMGSPFDRPVGFMKTFDRQEKMKIIGTIETINDNARV